MVIFQIELTGGGEQKQSPGSLFKQPVPLEPVFDDIGLIGGKTILAKDFRFKGTVDLANPIRVGIKQFPDEDLVDEFDLSRIRYMVTPKFRGGRVTKVEHSISLETDSAVMGRPDFSLQLIQDVTGSSYRAMWTHDRLADSVIAANPSLQEAQKQLPVMLSALRDSFGVADKGEWEQRPQVNAWLEKNATKMDFIVSDLRTKLQELPMPELKGL